MSNRTFRIALLLAGVALATQAAAQITFYEHDRFQGRSFTTRATVVDLSRQGFNDRASSVRVDAARWEVCEDRRFEGRCMVLRPGHYPSLNAMGLNDRVSSVRVVSARAQFDDRRYAPPPVAVYDGRRRRNERLYEADVTSVHAVLGPPEQRCWIEREQFGDGRGANAPGAVIGAVLGGILGHQVGGGSGRDLATIGGVVAGAAVGSQVGGDRGHSREVQRCTNTPSHARPEFWDVGYTFRGVAHHVQLTSPPGRTVTVNRSGEPRE